MAIARSAVLYSLGVFRKYLLYQYFILQAGLDV